MINSDEELSLEYLLSPEFEMINSAGKPLTDGWIEVYIHGTRNKYYCASDFDGTLHPFKIPLDSIGSNIVLADPANSYDVYVYNKFGSLIMSRYNVKCQGGGGTSTVEYLGDRLEYGQYTARDITTVARLARQKGNINTTQDGFLKLKEDMSYHITVRGTFVCDHLNNVATSLNYIEYSSFSPIKVDIDETVSGEQHFELSYDIFRLPNDMDYQVGFDASNGHISSLAVEVHSLSNLNTTLQGGDLFEQGWGIIIDNNVISVDPSIFDDYPTFDDLQAAVTAVYETVTNETLELVSSVSSVLQDEIDNIQQGVQADWEQDDPAEPDYIKNKPDLGEFATHDEVISTVSSVSSTLQNEIDELPRPVNADWNAVSGLAEILNKPDLDIYATKDEVSTATSTIENEISEVVNTVCAVSSVLDNKIDEVSGSIIHYQGASGVIVDGDTIGLEDPLYIEAGSGINFTSEGDTIVINADPVDLSDYATHAEVSGVSANLVETITNVSGDLVERINEVSGDLVEIVNNVSGDIIETVNDTVCSVSSVLDNRITEVSGSIIHYQGASGINIEGDTISLEDPLYIEAGSGINFTSEGDTITINADPVDLSDYATHAEVSGVSAVLKEIIDEVSAAVPDAQVQSDWTETDDTKKSYIQHKPEVKDVYAGENIILTDTASGLEISAVGTDTETVSAIAKEYADAVSAAIPDAQIQSDWTQDDTTKKDYIKHKPIPKKLVAGDGINITDTVTGVEISAAVTGIDGYVTEEEFIEVVSAVTATGDYGQFYCNSASGACTMGKVKGTIDVTNDGKIKLKQGKSYHMTVRGTYTQATPSNIDAAISFIEYVTNNSIGINVDRTSTMPQYFDLGFDLYNLSADTDYYVFFTGLAGTISNLFIEVHTILGGGGGNGGGGGGSEYNQGWGIVITNNTISVNPSIIPDVSNLATKNEVSAAISTATGAQINPDWNNSNPLSKAYIQNKPEEITLYGGQGVDIEVIGSSAIINVTGAGATGDWATRTQLASATDILQAEIEEVSGNIPAELTGASGVKIEDDTVSLDDPLEIVAGNGISFAQEGDTITISADIPVVTGYATKAELNTTAGELETEIQAVSSAIPAAQVNSDWNAVSGVSEILNKPVEYNLKAGNNITITKSGNDVTISSTGGGGGGATYSSGIGIDITNDVISVNSDVALASAIPDVSTIEAEIESVSGKLPTTEQGKFTIQNNVSGGPIEVICPTDVAGLGEVWVKDSNTVSGYYTQGSGSSKQDVIKVKSPGYAQSYWNAPANTTLVIDFAEALPVNATIAGYYDMADGSSTYWAINNGSYTVNIAGTHFEIPIIPNSSTSGTFGTFLEFRIYCGNASSSVSDDVWRNASMKLIAPDASQGIRVDLDRYYLGNTQVSTEPSSYLAAQVYRDTTTNKQKVYLTNSMPNEWGRPTKFVQYGTTSLPTSDFNQGNAALFVAYKSIGSNAYQFARLIKSYGSNSSAGYYAKHVFEYVDPDDNHIEYWIATTPYSSYTWTTETVSYATEVELQTVSGALDNYIPYAASGVYLPNSKFEIDTNGQAYKVTTAEREIDYNRFDVGIYFRGDGSSSVGIYRATLPSNVHHIYIDTNGGAVVTGTYDIATHSAILNVSSLPSNSSECYVFAYASNSDLIELSSSNATVKYIVPAVKEEYITESAIPDEISLVAGQNISIAVTGASAVISSTGGGGSNYTAGDFIDITNNEISVTDTTSVVAGDGISITQSGDTTTISLGVTAGITDIQLVNSLPASPVSTVLYLIPES